MKLVLSGYGRMGKMIEQLALGSGHEVLLAVGSGNRHELKGLGRVDVALDFSAPSMLPELSAYIRRTGTPLLSGTTGGNGAFRADIEALSAFAPVLHSANFSLGVAVLEQLSVLAAAALPGFDIEIIEAHHRSKLDAPSGTALQLANALDPANARGRAFGREGRAPRGGEIGVHAVRGGTAAGGHTVLFMGEDETLSLGHSAASRSVFAQGALAAAARLKDMPAGLYTLRQVLFGKEQYES